MLKKIVTWWAGPRSTYQVHRVMTWFWIVMAFPTVLWWNSSVPYLVFISVYAVIGFHIVAAKEARMELKDDETPNFRR